jgi:uncharacterized surface protein with fasciclin (FAS1) repeats
MRRLTLAIAAGAIAVGMIAGPVAAKQPDPSGNNIVDNALAINAKTGEFSTLIQLVLQLDLKDALSARGQLTVFAPTDAAFFSALGLTPDNVDDTIKALGANNVADIVLYHVAKGKRAATSVLGSSQIRMLNGDFAKVNGAMKTIDGAPIAGPNAVFASNGITHVISDVLLP